MLLGYMPRLYWSSIAFRYADPFILRYKPRSYWGGVRAPLILGFKPRSHWGSSPAPTGIQAPFLHSVVYRLGTRHRR